MGGRVGQECLILRGDSNVFALSFTEKRKADFRNTAKIRNLLNVEFMACVQVYLRKWPLSSWNTVG